MPRPKNRTKKSKSVPRNGKPQRQRAFLAAYRETASITKAAELVGIDRGQHYDWLEDAGYRTRFEAAEDQAGQLLEDEAVRRAHEGVLEPLVYQGEFTYPVEIGADGKPVKDEEGNYVRSRIPLAIRKYSDGLMQFLLRGFKSEKYRDRTEITGKDGGPIEIVDRLNAARQRLAKKPK